MKWLGQFPETGMPRARRTLSAKENRSEKSQSG